MRGSRFGTRPRGPSGRCGSRRCGRSLAAEGGGEQGHLRDGFCDAVVEGHGDGVTERDDLALEELVVIGRQRIGDEVLADEAVGVLVEVGARGLKAGQEREAARAVAALLAELALGRRLRRLAGKPATAWELPRFGAGEMP